MSGAEAAALGAQCEAAGVRFRAWSDKARQVSVAHARDSLALSRLFADLPVAVLRRVRA